MDTEITCFPNLDIYVLLRLKFEASRATCLTRMDNGWVYARSLGMLQLLWRRRALPWDHPTSCLLMSLWSIILTTTKSLVSNTTDPPRAQTLHLSELPVSPLSKDLYDSAHTYLIRFLPDTSQMIPGSPPGGEALSFRWHPWIWSCLAQACFSTPDTRD